MSQAVVRMTSPEEREYARYLAEIDARKRRAAELQAELETLKLALGRFEAEYHARVGALLAEVDRVRLAVDEYERRIARLRSDPDADPSDIEREVQDAFSSRREEVRAEEEDARRYERAYRLEQQRPRLDAHDEDEAKRVYRELAKRFHPDLARTEEERHHRERVMRRINASFRERDLNGLRAILQEQELEDRTFKARSIGEKPVWAIREVSRLDGVVAALVDELAHCRGSKTYQMWRRQEDGEGVVERLEADLGVELARERDRLAALVGTYRQLLEDGRSWHRTAGNRI